MTSDHGYPAVRMYIAGEWCQGGTGRTAPIVNPATEKVIGDVPLATTADLDRALDAATEGFRTWRNTPIAKRSAILHAAADLITERAPEIGRIMAQEQGKPLREGTTEALRTADTLRWHIEDARRAYGRIIPSAPGTVLTVRREPVGPVAAFVPWNFPVGGPNRKLSSALSAGCSIVIKASEETPGTAAALVACYADAGLPAGVLNLVFGEPAEVSAHLIPSPQIRLVAFTGSVPVGKLLAAQAGEVMKPTLMELGGHAPVIVCADADPVKSARKAAQAKFFNAGQVCTSPSRFFVHESIVDAFTAEFVKAAQEVTVGDGLDADTTMGPLANERRLQAMESLVADAVERGAKVLSGGQRLARDGYFYAPTVLTDVPADAKLMHEEPFGPLAPIVPFTDLEETLALANALPYGLAAYGFTESAATAEKLSDALEAGILSINHCGGSVAEAPPAASRRAATAGRAAPRPSTPT
ncbi:NAD-dependent succinate-semialdehyde dehydrogenase [Streptomyces galilaeus]